VTVRTARQPTRALRGGRTLTPALDMGLGKTLQTICILAAATQTHAARVAQLRDSGVDARVLPSVVVCPPTVTGHWMHELRTYAPSAIVSPLLYMGTAADRARYGRAMNMLGQGGSV
jgi:SNF2 family DNA or RNA helicase